MMVCVVVFRSLLPTRMAVDSDGTGEELSFLFLRVPPVLHCAQFLNSRLLMGLPTADSQFVKPVVDVRSLLDSLPSYFPGSQCSPPFLPCSDAPPLTS